MQVVHTFYSYWQSFSTHKSYAWEDQHDLRHAPNRRIQRLMEKENRKLRETAKKKTNETVRVWKCSIAMVMLLLPRPFLSLHRL